MSTPCQCPLAGYCSTHGRVMSAVRHRQCREQRGYFEAFAKSAGRQPIGPPRKSRGLGDTVAKITRATGLDKVAKAVARVTGKPCGCAERQAALNALVPYSTAPQEPPSPR